jgi:flagellar biosynthesis protein FlhF
MRIKKFRGKTILEALNRVKEEFGEQAVILASEQIKTEEGTLFEITAAIEEEEIKIKSGHQVFKTYAEESYSELKEYLKREICEIKKMLNQVLNLQPENTNYLDLIEKGVPPFIAKELSKANSDLEEFVSKALKEKGTVPHSKYQVFIGDSGTGKTTSVFKLAAWYKYKYEAKVLVISLDNYKIGSHFQTKRLAELLEVDFEILDLEELKEIAIVFPKYNFILIDTPSLEKRLLISDLEELILKMPFLRFQWVVRATEHYEYIFKQWERIEKFPVEGIVLTFVDKVYSSLPLLWILDSRIPPITFISNGERLPEDILKAEEEIIKKILFKSILNLNQKEVL